MVSASPDLPQSRRKLLEAPLRRASHLGARQAGGGEWRAPTMPEEWPEKRSSEQVLPDPAKAFPALREQFPVLFLGNWPR